MSSKASRDSESLFHNIWLFSCIAGGSDILRNPEYCTRNSQGWIQVFLDGLSGAIEDNSSIGKDDVAQTLYLKARFLEYTDGQVRPRFAKYERNYNATQNAVLLSRILGIPYSEGFEYLHSDRMATVFSHSSLSSLAPKGKSVVEWAKDMESHLPIGHSEFSMVESFPWVGTFSLLNARLCPRRFEMD